MKKILTTLAAVLLCPTIVWAAADVTVSFDPNGGSVGTTLLQVSSGHSLPNENEPTNTGSDFIGWSYDANSDYTIKLTEMKPTEDVTLYAHWMTNKSDTYTVVLDANGGAYTYSPRAYVFNRNGTTMDSPTTPRRDGYVFQGWSTSKTSTATVDINTISTAKTLYAVWSEGQSDGHEDDVSKVTVTFDAGGGTAISPIQVPIGTVIERPSDPTYTGRTFEGWYLNGEQFSFDLPIQQDITLVAHWSQVTKENFTVTFVAGDEDGGGSTFSDGSYMHSVDLTDRQQVYNQPTPKPTRTRSFKLWSTVKTQGYGEGGASVFDPAAPVNDNFTLYAVYMEADNSGLMAQVIFDANGGKWTKDDTNYETKKVSVDKNTKVTKPENPKRKGYEFKGWYSTDDDEPEKDEKWDFNDTVVEDITLYAHWVDKDDKDEDVEQASSTTSSAPTQQEVNSNFPNPEQLPVVEPTDTGEKYDGADGAKSVKDIPTTGIEFNYNCLIYLAVFVLIFSITIAYARSRK